MNSLFDQISNTSLLYQELCGFIVTNAMWTSVIGNLIISLSYFSIPIVIQQFVRKRQSDIPFKGVYYLFMVFIFLCGAMHFMSVVSILRPFQYEKVHLVLLVLTAVTSFLSAAVLWPLLPKALSIPSPAELRRTNANLVREIERRVAAERSLQDLNLSLEQTIKERTADLQREIEIKEKIRIAAHS
ncbi:hypothetical protein [Bacillus coahuilensis]|uniref:hypothetical protein n=1 Tax=Bacillus coahuilensis TaxID=408580 RepID=UPI0001851490|nr:hypothetical protein [Bacillus coahuilensis]